MNGIHRMGLFTSISPHVMPRRRPKISRGFLPSTRGDLRSPPDFEQLDTSSVRIPRRRLWVTTTGMQITIRFSLPTQNSGEAFFCPPVTERVCAGQDQESTPGSDTSTTTIQYM